MTFDILTKAAITYISSLSISEIIDAIILGKFSKGALNYAYQKVKQYQLERKYFFTPDTQELENIKSIENSDLYLRTEKLLKIHPLFSLLRLGIYINNLNEAGRTETIKKVKDKVYKKYKNYGLRVLSLATTGELDYVLEDLNDYYQRSNYDKIKICKLFDYILKQWSNITIFVKKEYKTEEIETKIREKIRQGYPYFFIFSYSSASINTYSIIAKLDNDGLFQQQGYLPQLRHKKNYEDYAWVMENIKKDILNFY